MKKEKLLLILLITLIVIGVIAFIFSIKLPNEITISVPGENNEQVEIKGNSLGELFTQIILPYEEQNNTDETTPDNNTTEPNNTDPSNTQSGEENTNPTTPNTEPTSPTYKWSGLMFDENDKTYEDHAIIDKYLPRSDTTAEWWQNKYFSSPDEETMYEDLGWLFDIEDEQVMPWNEFQHRKISSLFSSNGYSAIFVIEGDITPYEQAVAITISDPDTTVGEALAAGEWMYSIRNVSSIDDICKTLFGVENVEYASQLITSWGIPSKIYAKKMNDWTYNYAFEYRLSDCYVVIYGNEIPYYMSVEEKQDVVRGKLTNLTIYGLGEKAQQAMYYELRNHTEVNYSDIS